MMVVINYLPSEVGQGISRFNLIVSEGNRFRWDVLANHGVGPNDRVMANGNFTHDDCARIDRDVVAQCWIFIGFCAPLASSSDRYILIDRDPMSDPHLAAYNDSNRMGEIYGFQVSRWNLTTEECLEKGPKGCESSFQAATISFRMDFARMRKKLLAARMSGSTWAHLSSCPNQSMNFCERPIS